MLKSWNLCKKIICTDPLTPSQGQGHKNGYIMDQVTGAYKHGGMKNWGWTV